jgi:phage-related protein
MAYQTFTSIQPSVGGSLTPTARVLSAKFGDGYSQRVGDGINNINKALSITSIVTSSVKDTINTFLEARGGYEPFYLPTSIYTPYGLGSTELWSCNTWAFTPLSNSVWTLSISFNKEFDLA